MVVGQNTLCPWVSKAAILHQLRGAGNYSCWRQEEARHFFAVHVFPKGQKAGPGLAGVGVGRRGQEESREANPESDGHGEGYEDTRFLHTLHFWPHRLLKKRRLKSGHQGYRLLPRTFFHECTVLLCLFRRAAPHEREATSIFGL